MQSTVVCRLFATSTYVNCMKRKESNMLLATHNQMINLVTCQWKEKIRYRYVFKMPIILKGSWYGSWQIRNRCLEYIWPSSNIEFSELFSYATTKLWRTQHEGTVQLTGKTPQGEIIVGFDKTEGVFLLPPLSQKHAWQDDHPASQTIT